MPFSELGPSYGQMEYFTHEGFVFEEYVWALWFRVNGLIIFSFLFFFSKKFNWFLIVKFYFKLIYYEYGIFIEEAHHEEIREIMWAMSLDTSRRTNGPWAQSLMQENYGPWAQSISRKKVEHKFIMWSE